MKTPISFVALVAVVLTPLSAQAGPRFELRCAGDHRAADAALRTPRAVLDPWGELVVTGVDRQGREHRLRVTFPHELEFPAAGEHAISAKKNGIQVFACGAEDPLPGTLTVERFDWERITLSGRGGGDGSSPEAVAFAVDLRPEPHVAEVIDPRPVPAFEPPRDEPNGEDLVFCALGMQGTGWPGQHRVAKAVARLADGGPLDFVLLLGDNVLPRGVSSLTDPGFQRAFEQVYTERDFSVTPFYLVFGHRDKLGTEQWMVDYGNNVERWHLPHASYSFSMQSHGVKLSFIAIDAELLGEKLTRPEVRFSSRLLNKLLQEADGDWKIVFTNQPMYGHGSGSPRMRENPRRRLEGTLQRYGVDVYLAGGQCHLELLQPKAGITHVVSGGGGGPEMSRPVRWADDTVFAHTGGGFTWFRFDGQALEISFRDSDGKVLYVHRLRKPGDK